MRYIVDLCGTNVIGQRTPLLSCCDFVATPPDSQSGRSTLKDGDFPLRPSQSHELNS